MHLCGMKRALGRCMLSTSGRSDAEILSYLPMLKGVVRSVKGRVPSTVDGESLEAAAMLGLLQAFDGFDPSKGVPFETYARIRVRGAVQDELRGLDHLTRRQRRRVRSVNQTREAIERETGVLRTTRPSPPAPTSPSSSSPVLRSFPPRRSRSIRRSSARWPSSPVGRRRPAWRPRSSTSSAWSC